MPNSYVEPPAARAATEQLSFLSVINFVLRNLVFLVVPGVLLAILLVLKARAAPQTFTSTSIFSAGEASSPGAFLGVSLPGFIAGKGASFYVDLMTSPAVLDPLVEQKVQVLPGRPPETLLEHYGGTSQPRAQRLLCFRPTRMNKLVIPVHPRLGVCGCRYRPRLDDGQREVR